MKPEYLTHRDEQLGVDRRQRLAAAQLLLAFDLPAPMDLAARQMQEAAGLLAEGRALTMDEVGIADRRGALVAASRLISQMIDEIDEARAQAAVSGLEFPKPAEDQVDG